MKRPFLSLGLLLLLPAISRADDEPKATLSDVTLETPQERVSYGIGRSVGENLKKDGLDLDLQLIARGIADAIAGLKSPQGDQEFQEAFQVMRKETQAKAVVKNQKFIEENGKKEGVKTLASGLQYQVLKAGKGKKPTAAESVKAHYHGTFLDGKVFDSSYERDEPAVFPLNRVIKGWTEGVQLMQVGAKYRFWIPADLGYGPEGRPGIPPNALLVFDVELLDIISADALDPPATTPRKTTPPPKK